MPVLRILGLLLTMGPVAAQAGDTPLPPGFLDALARPAHRAALLQAVQAVAALHDGPCAQASYVTSGEVAMLEPVRVDSSGRLVGGAWKETVNETGCDAPRVLNALTTVRPNGELDTRPLLPGTTITDPQLQRDSVRYAAAGMGEMPPGCSQGGVVDTMFIGQDGAAAGVKPTAGEAPKPWTELWTLQACSKRVQVTLRFTPEAAGTDIEVVANRSP